MNKNIGKKDKTVRIVLGCVFSVSALFFSTGVLQIALAVAAVAMFFTAFTNYCLLYTLIGVNTCEINPKSN